jgi:hypothetical protein
MEENTGVLLAVATMGGKAQAACCRSHHGRESRQKPQRNLQKKSIRSLPKPPNINSCKSASGSLPRGLGNSSQARFQCLGVSRAV